MTDRGIPAGTLADVLTTRPDLIAARTRLDDDGPTVVERVRWRVGTTADTEEACVKFGRGGPHRLREAAVYTGWMDPRLDPVPRLIRYQALPDDWHILAIEWLHGRMPDFTSADDVTAVFGALGAWQARWSLAIAEGQHKRRDFTQLPISEALRTDCARIATDVRDTSWYHNRLIGYLDMFDRHRALCTELGGAQLMETFAGIREAVPALAARIASVPLTFDPGDLSAPNVLILRAGGVRFIDFEYAAIAPVSQVFESLGEDWETVPRGGMVERGLRAYTEAWAACGGVPMSLGDLQAAQPCLRLFRKCFELDADVDQLVTPGGAVEVRAWAVDVARDLPRMAEVALSSL